jgi:hypothetical protein
MTPKEKANELVDRYMNIRNVKLSDYSIIYLPTAKQCSLIAVDEIIASNPIAFDEDDNCIAKQWWQEVKIEIEKL